MKVDVKPALNNGFKSFYPLCHIQPSWQEDLEPNTWVKLLEFPNPYSFDEALLLCRWDNSSWVVWIPDHGQEILHSHQFFAE